MIQFIPSLDCGRKENAVLHKPRHVIEWRYGTLDKVKIKLYNTGEIAAFHGYVCAGHGWTDALMVRCVHTYEILCGYCTAMENGRVLHLAV